MSFGRRPTGSKTPGVNLVFRRHHGSIHLCLCSPIPGAPCCHTVNLIYIDPHCLDSGKELCIARDETRQQQCTCECAGIFPSVRPKISISLTSIVDGDFVRGVENERHGQRSPTPGGNVPPLSASEAGPARIRSTSHESPRPASRRHPRTHGRDPT